MNTGLPVVFVSEVESFDDRSITAGRLGAGCTATASRSCLAKREHVLLPQDSCCLILLAVFSYILQPGPRKLTGCAFTGMPSLLCDSLMSLTISTVTNILRSRVLEEL